MAPVAVFRLSPAGSAGATEYAVTVPPALPGRFVAMAVPLVYTAGFAEYVSPLGATSFTVMVRLAAVLPPLLVAVTV